MRKYGLLVYNYISVYQDVFEIISLPWNNVEVWPTVNPILVTDKNGQAQAQWPVLIYFKIVEDSDWGPDQDNAINGAVAAWNAANPTKQVPEGFQLVFTAEEAVGIPAIFESERQRLIALVE